MSGGGRFDFDDGGTYCGGWEDGKAHGYGVCTGPKGQGEYSGAWQIGFEISGIYTWPSGNCFEGQWTQGKRHGLGIEKKGNWIYRGEWTQGFKGRYGIRHSSLSGAKYEGTWTTGLQDGYGVETYADGGTYQGQWLRGMRHGYGVRQSVPYGMAAHYRGKTQRASLTSLRSEQEDDYVVKDRDRKVDEGRGGFVLQAKSDESPSTRRRSIFDKHGRSSLRNSLMKGLKLKKQKSTGDIQETSTRRPTGSVRSTASNMSHISAESAQSAVSNVTQYTDSNQSFVSQDDIADVNVTETYMGEWKNDKRCGFGVSERTDGLKYEGEWYNNKKFGYGVTTHKDGTREEGKYKNNVLVTSGKKSKFVLIRSSKLKERVDNAVVAAQRAATIALQKADIAISRMTTARTKAEAADEASSKAKQHSDQARIKAKEVAPEFHQPGTDILKKQMEQHGGETDMSGIHQNPVQNSLGRSQTLAMKRVGSAGNGSIGKKPQDLKLLMNHTYSPASDTTPKYSTLPRSLKPGNPIVEESISPVSQSKMQQAPVAENHISPRTPVSWTTTPSSEGMKPFTSKSGSNRNVNAPYQNGRPPTQRLSTLNSMDSFDHGMPVRDNSSMGRDFESSPASPVGARFMDSRSEDRYSEHSAHQHDRASNPAFSEHNVSTNSLRNRRKSQPSIMHKNKSIKIDPKAISSSGGALSRSSKTPQTLPTTRDDIMDTYVIENGIRKRVKAEIVSYPRPPSPTPSVASMVSIEDRAKHLPEVYRLEPTNLASSRNRGSLPDVRKDLGIELMPRSQASVLSQARRDELRRMREEAEARRNMEIVLRVADVKDWLQQRQLLILVVALNVGLATMFFNMLQ